MSPTLTLPIHSYGIPSSGAFVTSEAVTKVSDNLSGCPLGTVTRKHRFIIILLYQPVFPHSLADVSCVTSSIREGLFSMLEKGGFMSLPSLPLKRVY